MIASFIARVLNKTGLVHRYGRKDILPLKNLSVIFRTKLNGTIFKIPVVDKTGWENLFLTEGWFTGLLQYLGADKKWTVLDVGANIGQTLLKIKSIDREIKYYGFEPNPVCIDYLYRLIDKNHLKNSLVIPAGISVKTGMNEFFYYSDSASDPAASIINGYRPDSTIRMKRIVPVFDISDFTELNSQDEINLIKIDVEGAELEVLLSCEKLIRKHKPFIIIEILPVYSEDNQIRRVRQIKIEELIKSLDYKIYLIKKSSGENFEELHPKDQIGIHGDILNIDYLLVPKEKVQFK